MEHFDPPSIHECDFGALCAASCLALLFCSGVIALLI